MTEVYEVEDSKYIPSIMEVPSEDLLRMLNVLEETLVISRFIDNWEMEIKSRTLFQTGTEIVEFAEQVQVSVNYINQYVHSQSRYNITTDFVGIAKQIVYPVD